MPETHTMRFEEIPRALIARCELGEEAAIRELLDLIRVGVLKLVWTMVHNQEAAEEITQNVFVKVLQYFRDRKRVDNLSAWLMTIARNERFSWYRRHIQQERHEVEISGSGPDDPERPDGHDWPSELPSPRDLAANAELRKAIVNAVQKLPEQARRAFELFELQDLCAKEIAEILGCKEATVRFHVYTARQQLQKLLAHHAPPVRDLEPGAGA